MNLADKNFTDRKNKRKKIRIFLQIVILAVLAYMIVIGLFILKDYRPWQQRPDVAVGDEGFIALSYFGVARNSDAQLIGIDVLREQLAALAGQGYVTVTQQDILDYYLSGKPLPKKSLFLLFEDGRTDTAIFASSVLEQLNFKATMQTYPEKFSRRDVKFLMPVQLKELERTGYWEMGTNGYRLEFINVYDRYNRFLGELDPLHYAMLSPFLGRSYNHYLMDYLRDESGIPQESYLRMKERIGYDYEKLRDVYSSELGYVPRLYTLMHSNTGTFGNDNAVSAVNWYWIQSLFAMNFNREGSCFNKRNSSLYDLTRMQPQPFWPVNHLLMRIKYDTQQPVSFVSGDEARLTKWQLLAGAAEFKKETVILTSQPLATGLLELRQALPEDLKLSVSLKGNKLGSQRLYLRADEARTHYLCVGIENNTLIINERTESGVKNIFWLDLDQLDGIKPVSVAEDKKAAEMKALEAFARYAGSTGEAKKYLNQLNEKSLTQVPGVADGEPPYIAPISTSARGNRLVELSLQGSALTVTIDGKNAVTQLPVTRQSGGLLLEAGWSGYGWNQRNLTDDVYDGLFEKLIVTDNRSGKEETLYDGRLHGFDAAVFWCRERWNHLVSWFIQYL